MANSLLNYSTAFRFCQPHSATFCVFFLRKTATFFVTKLAALDIPDNLRRCAEDMTAFYYANKQDDCEYVVFPAANFNAYYGSTTFSKKKLPQLPQSVFAREERHGLCRLKFKMQRE